MNGNGMVGNHGGGFGIRRFGYRQPLAAGQQLSPFSVYILLPGPKTIFSCPVSKKRPLNRLPDLIADFIQPRPVVTGDHQGRLPRMPCPQGGILDQLGAGGIHAGRRLIHQQHLGVPEPGGPPGPPAEPLRRTARTTGDGRIPHRTARPSSMPGRSGPADRRPAP